MRRIKITLSVLLLIIVCCNARAQEKRVLVFFKTMKYYHESIPAAIAAIEKLGTEHRFYVDTTTDGRKFNDENLQKYTTVIFLSTTGTTLDTVQRIAFRRYIEAGGGYMGIHAASTSDKDWTWYGNLVGAVFKNHPTPQEGYVIVTDKNNPATRGLPARWKRMDEWYNFIKIPTDVHVLLCADETTYQGGTNGTYHPLAWYHEYDGGRSFYTALGHFADSYSDPLYLGHIWGGLQYAMGSGEKLDYSKVPTPPAQ